jgi:hypothetical protein
MAADIGSVIEILDEEPEINHLIEVLTPLEHQYQILGVQLEVENRIIAGMRQSNDDNSVKLYRILEDWINRKDQDRQAPVTWKTIIEVIEKNPIRNIKVKQQVIAYLNRDDIFQHYKLKKGKNITT